MDTGGEYGQAVSGHTACRLQHRRDCGEVCSRSPRVRRERLVRFLRVPANGMCLWGGKIRALYSGTAGIPFQVKAKVTTKDSREPPTYWRRLLRLTPLDELKGLAVRRISRRFE